MLKSKLKMIISLVIGVPATIIVCSESKGFDGFVLQLVALALLILIFAVNGMLKWKENNE